MKTNKWYPAIAGGQKIAVKFNVLTDVINTVIVSISVPCRKGQYVILYGVDNDRFTFSYNKGRCVVSWVQDTSNIDLLEYLFEDIRIWFRYSYAIRMDEGLFTSMELLRVF